ncbi:MAG: hypothetical protein WCX31_09590 [Salinivirgaceae bacterium]|jgi:hypothetical protein
MRKLKLTLFIAVLIGITAIMNNCKLEGDCFNQLEVPVMRFELPDSIAKDSTAIIKVIYATYSNCSKLNTIYTPWNADTMSIHVIADYQGCTCPDNLPDSIATFSFKPTAARNYILRAIKYDDTILQDTLKVY